MPEPKPKSSIGPTALLLIILVDVGLIILGWYVHQNRKLSYDGSGLSLSKAPETSQPASFAPSREEKKASEGSLMFVIKEKMRSRAAGAAQQGAVHQAGPGASPSARSMAVRKAVLFFFDLKKDPRFKDSPAIADWKREFLSYPDLRAVDEGFKKDGDALKFMVQMVRSPNFQSMVQRHLLKPEIQTFVNEMAKSSLVADSAKTFLEDSSISSAVQSLGLLSKAGAPQPEASPPQPATQVTQEGSEALKKVRESPTLKKYLEGEAEPAVRLEGRETR